MEQEILAVKILMKQTITENIVKMLNGKLLNEDYENIYREILEYEAFANPWGYSFIANKELSHKETVKAVFKKELMLLLDSNEDL